MMQHSDHNPLDNDNEQLRDSLKEFFEQIRFARAAELARSRRYLEAESLLAPFGQVPCHPRDLDLLARIAAQQRRYKRARHLWEAALEQSPGNADYQRAIERTRDAERSRAILQKGAMVAILGLATTALVIAVWTAFLARSPSAQRDGTTQQNINAKTTPLPHSSATAQSASARQELVSVAPQPTPTTPQLAPTMPEPMHATPQPTLATLRSPSPPTALQPATPSVAPEN